MLISIQAAIDIGTHLISKEGLGKPVTYKETFEL
jgi:uncharacterized protein YutE (UPF0331/DUF86 family)